MIAELTALVSVVLIDIVLAGDNAVVVGMAAAGLAPEERGKAILFGIIAAAVLRILFSVFTVQLLEIIGLTLAGGLLLLWVSWKLWREHRPPAPAIGDGPPEADAPAPEKTFRQAFGQIVFADVSMSLDNVLAVAGTARDHVWVLVVGLSLSVALMGVAARLVAGLLDRYRWIAYAGLALVAFVALRMIYEGTMEVYAFAEGF
ncbi:MAG: TerC family protein [Proteobacteria bacterium]|nr:TerC family protein [Pseudomonadota bacterium]